MTTFYCHIKCNIQQPLFTCSISFKLYTFVIVFSEQTLKWKLNEYCGKSLFRDNMFYKFFEKRWKQIYMYGMILSLWWRIWKALSRGFVTTTQTLNILKNTFLIRCQTLHFDVDMMFTIPLRAKVTLKEMYWFIHKKNCIQMKASESLEHWRLNLYSSIVILLNIWILRGHLHSDLLKLSRENIEFEL